jgi:hypothetical protein
MAAPFAYLSDVGWSIPVQFHEHPSARATILEQTVALPRFERGASAWLLLRATLLQVDHAPTLASVGVAIRAFRTG